jgi:hypothetical protein
MMGVKSEGNSGKRPGTAIYFGTLRPKRSEGVLRMKAARALSLVTFLLAVLSCSLFLAPMEGRYNEGDPKFDVPTTEILPIEDGYVDDTPASDFTGTILWINPPPSPTSVPLLRFDAGKFPGNVISAELHLWVSTAPSPATDIIAYPITEDWSPATVSWSLVSSGTFFDNGIPASVSVPDGFFGGYAVIEVTEVFDAMVQYGNYGMYLESTVGAMNLHSSRGTNPPKLVIHGYD